MCRCRRQSCLLSCSQNSLLEGFSLYVVKLLFSLCLLTHLCFLQCFMVLYFIYIFNSLRSYFDVQRDGTDSHLISPKCVS